MSAAEITRAGTRIRAGLVGVHGYEIELDVAHGNEAFLSSTTIFEQFDSFLDQHTDADAALVRAVREGRDLALRAAASRALTEAGG